MANKAMTEQQYLDVLVQITNKIKADPNSFPLEILSVGARVLSNLERLTVAQEVLAGIRNKDVLT